MEKKKLQNISIVALIISLLPFVTLIPVCLQIVLPDGLRTVWGCANIACVITGLCLSIVCVQNNESRSLIAGFESDIKSFNGQDILVDNTIPPVALYWTLSQFLCDKVHNHLYHCSALPEW